MIREICKIYKKYKFEFVMEKIGEIFRNIHVIIFPVGDCFLLPQTALMA